VAQVRCLAVAGDAKHAGLPRLRQAHAQHDGMVEVPVHAAGGGRANRPLPRVERRGTRPVAGGGVLRHFGMDAETQAMDGI